MKKFLTALVTVASLAAAIVATSGTAEARWGGGWRGGGWGYGAGGFVAGALIGGAIAGAYGPYGYYGGPYGYYGGYAPAPYYGPGCVWRRVWNGYAWVRACY